MIERTIEAIYENGALRPVEPIGWLAEHAKVKVTIATADPRQPWMEVVGIMPDEDAAELRRVIDEEFEKVNRVSGNRVILDTSAAIAVLNGEPMVGAWLGQFTTLRPPATAIGELRFGALNSARGPENLMRIDRLIARSDVLDVTESTAHCYAELRLELKRKGRPVPENDLWIAAAAVEHGLPLAARDVHFTQFPRLSVLPPP